MANRVHNLLSERYTRDGELFRFQPIGMDFIAIFLIRIVFYLVEEGNRYHQLSFHISKNHSLVKVVNLKFFILDI